MSTWRTIEDVPAPYREQVRAKIRALPKRSKYRSTPVTIDGIVFASKHEGRVYEELKIMQRVGEVKAFRRQIPFVVKINDKDMCKYYCDFLVQFADGHVEVWDAKGYRTKEYRLKKKLVEAQHGVKIIEK